MLKRLGGVLALLLLATLPSLAAVRGDVKVLEATETIRYRVNDLTKNYLLLYRFPAQRHLREKLQEDLEALTKSFQEISLTTKDTKTKNLLAYFAYEKARLEEILESKPSKENLQEILGMSEGFIEGADAIARHHAYDFAFEEKMLMHTRSMTQRMEEILKYYLALHLLPDDPQLRQKFQSAVKEFQSHLKLLNEYEYHEDETLRVRERLNHTWGNTSRTLKARDDLPWVLNVAGRRIETLLERIGIYHSKNQ